jgi:sulfofructose kinase
MPSPASVLCIGHATVDLVIRIEGPPPDDQRILASDGALAGGGPAATAAVALARLGVPVTFLGTVGRDRAGDLVVEGLRDEGVDVSRVRRVDAPTAISAIWVDGRTGHRSIAAFYQIAGVDHLTPGDIEVARGSAWIHLDSPGFRAARLLRAAGVRTPISLDAGNPVPDLDLRLVDLYAPTEERLLDAFGPGLEAAIDGALEAGPEIVAITRGASGSIAARRADDTVAGGREAARRRTDGRGNPPAALVTAAPFHVPVVSTLGAGDVFHGALLAGLVRGLELEAALTLANAVAALSCRALDGRSAIPTWDEAVAFADAAGRPIAVAARVAVPGPTPAPSRP